ncbi:ribonuclease HI large subunit [Cucurbitaria berberidis CBS 394.84]|uniref:Ribonuclease n=1 Tax=Cucurbitaria berberidis CBS 394.84 TaxID=1168544 RepID=A0A9P4GG90_9PLEO|nr:ribonuclease HI large subunit [Cucurbitaria berberidis CBS 394.84]KAF1844674.1 ribonuclease HI large subunit [Cucurbitaria berberidis CBS 394.84]
MAEIIEDVQMDTQEIEQETPPSDVFMAPSIYKADIQAGKSYSHFSPIPQQVAEDMSTEVVLGVDEAGRGPVLGPMVYALFYLPIELHHSLLADTHHFDDSKVLTPQVRSNLMRKLCTKGSDLYQAGGWATRLLSAQDISAHMLSPAVYNLNAQAMDATIDLIKGVLAQGVNVTEIYIDTIGRPEIYQKKLERIWPTIRITVAKKADSLYPCVSAASVCAKVTRDAALDVCYEPYHNHDAGVDESAGGAEVKVAWGSGYPSDTRTSTWLKQNMDPLFGWGNECRFSWSTAKELLEGKKADVAIDWPVEDDSNDMRMTDFFAGRNESGGDELVDWFGKRVTEEMEVF